PAMQHRLAQFFTPYRVAELLAAMPRLPGRGSTLHVLDPGAGSGMLTAAVVRRLAAEAPGCSVRITAVELDERMLPSLEATAAHCREWAHHRGMSLEIHIREDDFLVSATDLWDSENSVGFDLVLMNPPYAKLPANSVYRRKLRSV